MTHAFTFPGQGSQAVGMGRDLAEAFPEARAVFDEVDSALGQKLSAIMWEGPEEELTLTANAQPALMSVSMAAMRVLESRGLDLKEHVACVAGHSLGEYSALCAAGMLTLADTARLLRIRGNAMQDAVPVGEGAMAAIIGLTVDVVEDVCREAGENGVCEIANDNGGGQFVVSGHAGAIDRATAVAEGKGARRAIKLPVSAPFHSTLMEPAATIMRTAIAEVEIGPLSVPVVANVTAEPVDQSVEESNRLVEQVTGRVRWRETIEWMAANGVDTVHEIGTGKVLTGLVRRIDRSLAGMALNTPADLEKTLEALGL
ncbi:ACP S-malonyltransferase [Pararhizobium mangrovi]|uniref:Malonyl CoA-acyl carrier protein transacylase n=1 Tax=Pararhizobium mangrovi TaxID=2590452 RepID=A0A506UGA6_9HYPH|nr:ACP S-malonyltransferase [Pararhizobium mangrovi]TPW32039.1 ACP S-malonyltransferase [Pararhizobium mangrovi]